MIVNAALDQEPIPAGTNAFVGVDQVTRASLLADAMLAACTNGLLDSSGQLNLRPGTVWIATPTSSVVQGIGYFDAMGTESQITVAGGRCWATTGTDQNENPVEITGFTPALSSTGKVTFAQLVDKLFLHDGTTLYRLSYAPSWTVAAAPTSTRGTGLKSFA